ncbi:MAG: hypothetical protein JSS02_33720, partial [Planctomycetes bacterium]|nr:hypothetical protein [Planctomycetota bacterium]
RAIIDQLTGDKPDNDDWKSPRPWRIERFPVENAGWVLLEGYAGNDIPDVSRIRVHIFDPNWKRVMKQTFPTGYRMRLTDISLVRDTPLGQPCLVAQVSSTGPFIVDDSEKPIRPAFERGKFQRQYYALAGNQFVMVRLEDENAEIVPNHYLWRSPTKGPQVPDRKAEDWIQLLRSENSVDQLAALVWLTGRHMSSKAPRSETRNQESVSHAAVYEAVRSNLEAPALLAEIAVSKNEWVRQYAKLALRGDQGP